MTAGATITTVAVSVTTSATLLTAGGARRDALLIQPATDIYIGGSNVTTSNGVKVATGTTLDFTGDFVGELYGICSSGTVDTRVLSVS